MNEFVDRLAKVLAVLGIEKEWDRLGPASQAMYRGDVRRVLMSAIEPTEKMTAAATLDANAGRQNARLIWRAMMREALRDD